MGIVAIRDFDGLHFLHITWPVACESSGMRIWWRITVDIERCAGSAAIAMRKHKRRSYAEIGGRARRQIPLQYVK